MIRQYTLIPAPVSCINCAGMDIPTPNTPSTNAAKRSVCVRMYGYSHVTLLLAPAVHVGPWEASRSAARLHYIIDQNLAALNFFSERYLVNLSYFLLASGINPNLR